MSNRLNYQHYLITRFNLKQNVWTGDKSYNPLAVINEGWLKGRFELFETYCLPSVQAQTDKSFKWIVYFDTDTPEKYKKIIQNYQNTFSNFSPRFIPSMQHLFDSIKNEIATDAVDVVITSRLDNDDSLHENYMQKIHECIEGNNITNGVVDIPNGYCLEVKGEPVLYKSIQYSNAFITYIEPYVSIKELVTVMGKQHNKWAYSVKTFVIKNERLWMQIIHEKNVMNKAQGIILNKGENLVAFHLNRSIIFENNIAKRFIDNNYLKFPIYYFKKQLKKGLIKLRTIGVLFKG